MYQLLVSCNEAATAAIPLIPIFLMLDHCKFHNPKRSFIYMILAIYLGAMYAAVGLPDITYCRYSPRFNFDPFLYMFSAWDTTALNVLLFLPLGWFLPVLWKKYQSAWRTLLLGFCTSLTVEFLQIFTYRATDVNDLITNTFGTGIGYLLGIATLKFSNGHKVADDHIDLYWIFSRAFFIYVYPLSSLPEQPCTAYPQIQKGHQWQYPYID